MGLTEKERVREREGTSDKQAEPTIAIRWEQTYTNPQTGETTVRPDSYICIYKFLILVYNIDMYGYVRNWKLIKKYFHTAVPQK